MQAGFLKTIQSIIFRYGLNRSTQKAMTSKQSTQWGQEKLSKLTNFQQINPNFRDILLLIDVI